jgi:molybdenum ABC transporter molybdate-binding protein
MRNGFYVAVGGTLVLGVALFFSLKAMTKPAQNEITSKHLMLYCAAGMRLPVEATLKQYEEEYGVAVDTTYEGSNTLLAKIVAAGRGDLYLAADDSYIEIARDKGLLKEGLPLATMSAVIAVQKGNPHGIKSVNDLLNPELTIGLANFDAAAVGRISRKILQKAGIWEQVEQALVEHGVTKPTVTELANDVKLGTVDVALLWDATVNQYPELELIRIEDEYNTPQDITVGVLTSSEQPTQALHLARYLAARDRGLRHFADEHYEVVDGDKWVDRPQLTLHIGGVLRAAVEDTLDEFSKREGVDITTVYNGCGILVGNMKAGDHPDAYFACDRSFMSQVSNLFQSPLDVSQTRMVVCVPKGNPQNIKTVADLDRPGLKLGVCNREQSALGELVASTLENVGLYDDLADNIAVQVPTADALVADMLTGHLDAAIVYWANYFRVRDKLDYIPLDEQSGAAVQPVAVGKNTEHKYLMGRLMEALTSAHSRDRFEESGFEWLLSARRPSDTSP